MVSRLLQPFDIMPVSAKMSLYEGSIVAISPVEKVLANSIGDFDF